MPEQTQEACETQVDATHQEVETVLDKIRPMLMMDGGNIELVDVKDGEVFVHLVGACGMCPSSTMTLKMGVERALKESLPSVKRVVQV
jgi:Fe-S cluster biogenesis protein NfuA